MLTVGEMRGQPPQAQELASLMMTGMPAAVAEATPADWKPEYETARIYGVHRR